MQDTWDSFWFKPIDPRQYAALRIAFGGLTVIYFLQLLPYVEAQFSGTGWLGDIQQIAIQNGGSWSLFFLRADGHATTLAYAIVISGIITAFLMMIGWQSRLTTCITWLVWVSLWNRNPLLLDGDDAVLKVMCFYLMLSPCGNCWSVDAYLCNKPQIVGIWPLRLVQFQITLIYFVSGWVKFHSPEWLDGTILQHVLINPQYSRWNGWVMIYNPIIASLLPGFAWIIRWWELLFPFLLLNTYTRRIGILMGILFHLGLLLTMNLRWFAVIMLMLYIALISNDYFIYFEQKLLKSFRSDGRTQ